MTVTVEQGATAPFPNAGYKRPISEGFTRSTEIQDLLFGPSTPGEAQLLLPRTGLVFLCFTANAHDEMGRPAYSTNCLQLSLNDYQKLHNYPEPLISRLMHYQTQGLKLSPPPPLKIQEYSSPSFKKKDYELLHSTFTKTQLLSLLLVLLASSQRFYVSATVKVSENVNPLSIVYAYLKLIPSPLRTFSWSTCRNGVFSPEQPHSLICIRDSALSIRYENVGGSFPPSLQYLARSLLAAPELTKKNFNKLYYDLPPKLAKYYAPIEFMADTSEDQSLMQWLIKQYLSVKLYSRVAKYAQLLDSF